MTTQQTDYTEILRNLATAFERLAAEAGTNPAKPDGIAETLANTLQTQTRLTLLLARMNERQNIMNEAEARRDMREAEAREAREARHAKTAKLQFRAIYTLTAICVALLIVIITKSVFFPA